MKYNVLQKKDFGLIKENSALNSDLNNLDFKYLPEYAEFILKNKLKQYTLEQIRLGKKVDMPLMKHFEDLSDEQLVEFSTDKHKEFLKAASANQLSKYLQNTIKQLEDGELDIISKNHIVADDIHLGSFIRKNSLTSFLREYTSDTQLTLNIISEIDTYEASSAIAAGNLLEEVFKQQQKELKIKNELYLYAQKLVKMGNWEWDVLEDKIVWSEGMYDIFEQDNNSTLSTREFSKIVHPDDADVLNIANTAIREKKNYEVNYRIVLPDGRVKYINSKATVAEMKDGEVWKMKGVLRDVTEQRKTDIKLKEYSAFIGRIADTSPSLITSYNIVTQKYIFINSAVTDILGYDIQDVSGAGTAFFEERIHPDDVEYYRTQQNSIINLNGDSADLGKEQVVEYKYRIKNNDGKYRWLHTYTTVFDRDDTGEVQNLLSVSNDITDQVHAEQVLYQKNIQLQQSNSSLQEFAYVASHDLKEPLRKITTFGDRLEMKLKDVIEDDAKVYLDKIINAAHRMQVMITDLMSVSTITGNKEYEVCDLDDILKDAEEALEHTIETKGAKIISDDLPEAKIVVSQFRQLFQNLLGNSLKFSREGVSPEIRITYNTLNTSEVNKLGLSSVNNYIEITFQDNGIGFENEFNNKIFTIFKRLNGKSEYEGSGIGLAICRKVVENHNGIITAEGTPGQGAKFTIVMPL